MITDAALTRKSLLRGMHSGWNTAGGSAKSPTGRNLKATRHAVGLPSVAGRHSAGCRSMAVALKMQQSTCPRSIRGASIGSAQLIATGRLVDHGTRTR